MAKLAGSSALRPVAHAIDVDDVEHWVASAEVGAELVYAWGLSPPRDRAAWVRARELFEEGEVRLHDRRRPTNDREWYMVKRAMMVGGDAAPVIADPVAETEEAAVLRILRRHVRLGLPCGTNAEIGRQVEMTAAQVAYRIRLLRAARLISMEERGPGERRICTISGRSTPAGRL
ncbi:hypothetical protein [Sphingomonas sp. Leaf37]|uniref:hypothetical protein n=1 Tax=Sphingomonas sp. Leaf37 TaxID=2876552 RepID=UPI001E36EC3D|nr:hypothetical protein [Sphingomonas sp. Leaf37]